MAKPRLLKLTLVQNEGSTVPAPTLEEKDMLTSRESLELEELTYFGLESDPFDLEPSPAQLWMGPQQKRVEHELLQTARFHKITIVVGEVGSGKTSLVRRLMLKAQTDRRIKCIVPSSLERAHMSQGVLPAALIRGLDPAARMPRSLDAQFELATNLLQTAANEGVNPVLLVDEAHELNVEGLIALKRLWDTTSLHRLLGIVLVGQGNSLLLKDTPAANNGLDRRLADVRVREFFQRARVINLLPMGAEEIAAYITTRYQAAGADASVVWDPSAFAALASFKALSFPLSLNNSAVRVLRTAYQASDKRVTGAHVARALNQKVR